MEHDIRWEQRFSNFNKVLLKLSQSVVYIKRKFMQEDERIDDSEIGFVLDEMIKEGLIQRFEYTHELAWKVMKDYAAYQGNATVGGSRDATREAFQMQLVSDGKVWMDMIGSRNKTSHTYNATTADEIYGKILHEYYPVLLEFQKCMETKRNSEQGKQF